MSTTLQRLLSSCAILALLFACDSTYHGRANHGTGGTLSTGAGGAGTGASTVENPQGGSATGGDSSGGTSSFVASAGSGLGGAIGVAGGSTAAGTAGTAGTSGTAGTNAQVALGGAIGVAGGSTVSGSAGTAGAGATDVSRWVGTWATGPQLTEPANMPPSPGLSGNTLRQIVYTSIGGSRIRLRLSNEFGDAAVSFNSVHVATSVQGSTIAPTSDRTLTFSGVTAVSIPAGAATFSDPLDFTLAPLTKVAITTFFATAPANVTGHPGSRTTSYLQSGDATAAASLSAPATTDHWYYITGIDVAADTTTSAIVALGDSITDGRGSTTNGNDRWPDALSRRLQANASTVKVAVLNQGIGGNTVLTGGLGPTARARFARDVLGQRGAKWVIILEGVNDIGYASSAAVATDLIAAFDRLIIDAHAANLLVLGVPILPFGGSSYDSALHETARQTVNTWIRTSGKFDAVLDLDAAVSDPAAPTKLLASYDSGDHLHLSPAGYQKMADAIDLAQFAR